MKNPISIFFLILLGICAATPSSAQVNIVPNPSFEDTVMLDWGFPMPFPTGWNRPPISITTPDLFHTGYSQGHDCTQHRGIPQNGMGYSYAKHGDIYLGLLHMYTQGNQVNSREYVQAKLSTPMVAGTRYRVGMYVKRAGKSQYALNGLGILLTDTATWQMGNVYINATPQISYTGTLLTDTMNWTKIEGLHVAAGGEEYITIGNFKSDANSNITMVNPNANWCWLVSYSGYYFVDSVYAYPVENVGISDQEVDNKMEIYPNPTENEFYVELANLPDFGEITLSDIQGKTIVTQTISSLQSRISTEALPAGIYYVTVSDKQHTWKRKIQKR